MCGRIVVYDWRRPSITVEVVEQKNIKCKMQFLRRRTKVLNSLKAFLLDSGSKAGVLAGLFFFAAITDNDLDLFWPGRISVAG